MKESMKILIASAHAGWQEKSGQAVENMGHDRVYAKNTQEVEKVIQDQDLDLILIDWTLDGIREAAPWEQIYTGPEINQPFLVVVFEEGTSAEGALHAGFQFEPDGYLFRPASEQELTARLEILLRHKTSRDDLLVSEARTRSIFRAVPVGIGLVSDRTIQEVNDKILELTGYQREELIGQNARILYPTEDEYRLVGEEKYSEMRQQGTGTIQTRFQRKDGRILDVLLSSTPLEAGKLNLGVTFSVLDITDRVKALKELKEVNQLLDNTQEIARVGSWIMDLESRKLTWTDEVYRIFGVNPGEFEPTYQAFLNFVHPEDRDAVDEAYNSSLERGHSGYEIEHRVIRQDDGQVRYVHEKCEHIKNESGDIIRSMGMVQDITERVRVREELREHREHLEEEVRKRTANLREMVNAMAGREVRMAELKKVNQKLRKQLKAAGLVPVAEDPLQEFDPLGDG